MIITKTRSGKLPEYSKNSQLPDFDFTGIDTRDLRKRATAGIESEATTNFDRIENVARLKAEALKSENTDLKTPIELANEYNSRTDFPFRRQNGSASFVRLATVWLKSRIVIKQRVSLPVRQH
jgi:hypothetical protein